MRQGKPREACGSSRRKGRPLKPIENEAPKIKELVILLHKEGRSNKRILKTVNEVYPDSHVNDDTVQNIIKNEGGWEKVP